MASTITNNTEKTNKKTLNIPCTPARIFFVPCSGETPRKNFKNTVSNPKTLDYLRQYVDDETASNLESTGRTKFGVWGFGSGSKNSRYYKMIQPGDLIVFSRRINDENFIYACGTVVYSKENERLSENIWDLDKDHTSFKNVFFMIECYDDLHIRMEPTDLGYSWNYHFGTTVPYDSSREQYWLISNEVNNALLNYKGKKVC